ncbi:maleylacetoacetate isomerase [Aestuariirhabdus sp. Z084]|uniref:maleylacetoacetate isomerase n=1 Tax=Aestuariirhabdus haliotis TaxID=2918751 RepID=UPI00201B3718|nr:maleylacetoacetate isomerase [Aestuariirhabdus haliotis]MCL6416812.1 maleylacetoacetate isomerase [Aestuariirhabdus haliotis]MCL6420812.1 maleylacetoacetate isomerase [Aestuariirhabdus haliotis]
MMKLYTYWRSSAAYRVRIALNLKQIVYQPAYLHLVNNGGEQHADEYRQLNPQMLVPALELDNGRVLTQSMAIMEYLDEVEPGIALLPADALGRARVRALAQLVACEIHPLNNLRVLQYLSNTIEIEDQQKKQWYQNWVTQGFNALETMLKTSSDTGTYCHGESPGLADACLIPQVYNANRFDIDLTDYPTITRINSACLKLQAFQQAVPEAQGDAQ